MIFNEVKKNILIGMLVILIFSANSAYAIDSANITVDTANNEVIKHSHKKEAVLRPGKKSVVEDSGPAVKIDSITLDTINNEVSKGNKKSKGYDDYNRIIIKSERKTTANIKAENIIIDATTNIVMKDGDELTTLALFTPIGTLKDSGNTVFVGAVTKKVDIREYWHNNKIKNTIIRKFNATKLKMTNWRKKT